jgi:hypothetical protein
VQHEDPTVPDTAMATGNDVGEPGGPTPQPLLDPDEQALLEEPTWVNQRVCSVATPTA